MSRWMAFLWFLYDYVCVFVVLPSGVVKWIKCSSVLIGKSRGQGSTEVSGGLHRVARELQCASGLSYTAASLL